MAPEIALAEEQTHYVSSHHAMLELFINLVHLFESVATTQGLETDRETEKQNC